MSRPAYLGQVAEDFEKLASPEKNSVAVNVALFRAAQIIRTLSSEIERKNEIIRSHYIAMQVPNACPHCGIPINHAEDACADCKQSLVHMGELYGPPGDDGHGIWRHNT